MPGLDAALGAAGADTSITQALQTADLGVFKQGHLRRQCIEQPLDVLRRLQQRITIAAPDRRLVMPGSQFLAQRLTSQELCRSTHRTQGLQLGLDLGQLARIADRKEIPRFVKVAFDAVPDDALAHLVAGGTANRGIGLVAGETRSALQLGMARMLVGDHEPRVARRCTLRGALAVDHHDACLGMQLRQ
ncbi:hypothetical protein D3C76_1232720 [compost metagenome]